MMSIYVKDWSEDGRLDDFNDGFGNKLCSKCEKLLIEDNMFDEWSDMCLECES